MSSLRRTNKEAKSMEVLNTVVNFMSSNPTMQLLIGAMVFSALMAPLLRYQRLQNERVLDAALIATQDEALTMGIPVTEADTIASMRAKIAVKRLTR
jgi:low affinity Fe/Cu permease